MKTNKKTEGYYHLEKDRLLREIKIRESRLAAIEAAHLDKPHRMASEALSRREKFISGSYFSFIRITLRESNIYGIWERILIFFRRFKLITILTETLLTIITIISTSAFYLVFISLSLVALPFTATGIAFVYFRSLFGRKRILKETSQLLSTKGITVIFMPSNHYDKSTGAASCKMADHIAAQGDVVFIVAPINTRLKLRQYTRNTIIINQRDYFYFNKKIFERASRLTKIHL